MKHFYFPLLLSIGLIGCSDKQPLTTDETAVTDPAQNTDQAQSTSTPSTEQQDEFVSALPADAPVIKVGTEANYAPYEFKDNYGKVTGFDIDLIREIGEHQGFKVEVYNDPWEDVFTNLENGSRDMVAAGLAYSDERQQKYGVSQSYAPIPSSLVYVNPDIKINTIGDMKALKVGALTDSAQFNHFNDNHLASSVEPYDTVFLAVQSMVQGKIDAVAADDGVLRYTMSTLPDMAPKFFAYESITDNSAQKIYVVDKKNKQLLDKLNAGIEQVKSDGTYKKLTEKWFQQDLTPKLIEQHDLLEGTVSAETTN